MGTTSFLDRLVSWVAVSMLAISLGYVVYLYPGPGAMADVALAADEPQLGQDAGLSKGDIEAVRAHYRKNWAINLLLFTCGSIGAMCWLRSPNRRSLWAWLGMLSILGFVALFLLVVIPANSASIGSWLPDKMDGIKKLVAIRAWSFVAAELHRIVSITVGLLAFVLMLISLCRTDNTQH